MDIVVSNYDNFLFQAVKILRTDYEPSDLDILYAEGVTSSNGVACVEFSFPQSASDETVDTTDLHDSLVRYVKIFVPFVMHQKCVAALIKANCSCNCFLLAINSTTETAKVQGL